MLAYKGRWGWSSWPSFWANLKKNIFLFLLWFFFLVHVCILQFWELFVGDISNEKSDDACYFIHLFWNSHKTVQAWEASQLSKNLALFFRIDMKGKKMSAPYLTKSYRTRTTGNTKLLSGARLTFDEDLQEEIYCGLGEIVKMKYSSCQYLR